MHRSKNTPDISRKLILFIPIILFSILVWLKTGDAKSAFIYAAIAAGIMLAAVIVGVLYEKHERSVSKETPDEHWKRVRKNIL